MVTTSRRSQPIQESTRTHQNKRNVKPEERTKHARNPSSFILTLEELKSQKSMFAVKKKLSSFMNDVPNKTKQKKKQQ